MSDKQREVPSWDVLDFPKPGPAGDFESDVPAENNSDAETDSAFSRIEDALRDVAYQLGEPEPAPSSPDAPEHTQAPNTDAVTLEYTRSFIELAQRIDNLENNTDSEPLRDEIRGLRQRLVADADQFNRALDESAGKVSTLSSTVENLCANLAAMRDESAQLGNAPEEHLNNLKQSLEHSQAQLGETEKRIQEMVEGRLSFAEQNIENVFQRVERTELGRERSDQAVKQALTALLEKLSAEKERNEIALAEARASLTSTIEELQQSLDANENSVREGLESRLSAGETKIEDLTQRLNQTAPDFGEIENGFDSNFDSIRDQLTAEKNRSADALAELRAALTSSVSKMQQGLDATEKQVERTLEGRLSSVDARFESIARRLEQSEQPQSGGDSAFSETVESMSLRLEQIEQEHSASVQPFHQAVSEITRRLDQMEQERNRGVQPLNELVGDITQRLEQMEQDSVAKASLFELSIAELKEQLIAEKTRSEEARAEMRGAVADLKTKSSDSALPRGQSFDSNFAFENASPAQEENNRPVAEIIEALTASQDIEDAQDWVEPMEADLPDLGESVDVSSIVPSSFDTPPIETTDAATSGVEESFSGELITDESQSEELQSEEQQILAGAGDYLSSESDAATGAADAVHLDDVSNAPLQSLATGATGFEEKLAFLRQNRMAAIGAAILLIVGAGIILFGRGSGPDPDNSVAEIVPAIALEQVVVDAGLAAPLLEQSAAGIAAPNVATTILSPLPTVEIQGPAVSGLALSAPQAAEPGGASTLENLISQANAGSSPAALLLGLKFLNGDGVATNESEAFRWLLLAAEQGEPIAQNRLGSPFEHGQGVAADAGESTFWFGQAATGGNVVAMHNLAIAHTDGTGVERNLAEAARLFQEAANLGLADSQFNLAVLHSRGMGVPASLSEAYKWYLIAAAQGDPEAQTQAEALASQLVENERGAAEAAASAFVPRSLDEAANTLPSLAQIQ